MCDGGGCVWQITASGLKGRRPWQRCCRAAPTCPSSTLRVSGETWERGWGKRGRREGGRDEECGEEGGHGAGWGRRRGGGDSEWCVCMIGGMIVPALGIEEVEMLLRIVAYLI